MPFTFSHPAIILPLKHWFSPLSLSALIIGSTTPDFEYFIRMKMQGSLGHSWWGLLWFNLPVGMALYLVWHGWVKRPLIENLPFQVKTRLQPSYNFNGLACIKTHWFIIILSLLLGSASHLVWDGFTHLNGFDTYWPLLNQQISVVGLQIPFYSLLQHASTLLGGIIMMVVLFKQPTYTTTSGSIFRYWCYLILFTGLISGIRLWFLATPWFYGDVIATLIAAGLLSLILTPWLINRRI